MNVKRLGRLMIVLAILAGPAVLAAGAPAPPPTDHPNVSVTLVVGRGGGSSGSTEKVYRVLGQEGSATRMLIGWRTPIPTRSSEDKGGEPAATSYVYQNVGLSADFEVNALDGDWMRVDGQIEISGARDGPTGSSAGGPPPTIGTYQQALHVVLRNGQKLRVAEGVDPEGGSMYLELRADRLK